jgi:hypothetical protein
MAMKCSISCCALDLALLVSAFSALCVAFPCPYFLPFFATRGALREFLAKPRIAEVFRTSYDLT